MKKILNELERKIFEWLKVVPSLPVSARRWLGVNAWRAVFVLAIISGLGALFAFFNLAATIGLTGVTAGSSYYVVKTTTSILILRDAVSTFFWMAQAILLAMAVVPLKERQKKGWVLLFISILVLVAAAVIEAVLTLNVFSMILSLMFNAIIIAVLTYLVFEIHGEFAHVQKSKGVQGKK